jgi:hypothetical protein
VSHLWSGEFRFQFVLVEPCRVLRIGDLLHSQVYRTPPRAWVGDLHHFQVYSYPVLRAGDLEVLLSVVILPEQCLYLWRRLIMDYLENLHELVIISLELNS